MAIDHHNSTGIKPGADAKEGPVSLLKSLIRHLFGSFNGIQVFLYPGLLIYWMQSDRLIEVVSDLLGIKIHFFPLSIFMLLFLYMIFIVIKHLVLFRGRSGKVLSRVGAFVVDVHEKLLAVLICFALLFVFAGFFKYFYGINLPIKLISSWTARALGGLLILYYYLGHVWQSPWLQLGHSIPGAITRTRVYARMHPRGFIAFNLFQIIMVLVLARVYVNMLEFIYHPLITLFGSATGLEIELNPVPLGSNLSLFWNALLTGNAFLISNFFFIPLVWLARLATGIMHPIRPVIVTSHHLEN
jgi:hypothetical protein